METMSNAEIVAAFGGWEGRRELAGVPESVPEKIEGYRFNRGLAKDVAAAVAIGTNTLLTGPAGCGKTSLPQQIAAIAGIPVLRLNCDGELRRSHLLGQHQVGADGAMTFRLSLFARAVDAGWWVILDELDAAPPAITMALQPLLEEDQRQLLVPEYGAVRAGKGFHLFATGNTFGWRSRARADFAGTLTQNSAFVDRFGSVIEVGYSDAEEELERLGAYVEITEEYRDFYIALVLVVDKLRADPKFKADLSMRRVIQWARLLPFYDYDLLHTAELAVVRKLASAQDATVFRELLRRTAGYSPGEKTKTPSTLAAP